MQRHHSQVMYTVMRIGTLLILASTQIYGPQTILESAHAGHRVPILYAMVPGVPIDITDGWLNYAAVCSFHVMLVFLGGMGTCAADLMLVLQVMHMLPLAEIFEQQVGELNGVLTRSEDGRNTREFRVFFRNIVQMHKEISEFVRQISKIFYYVFFMEIYSDSLSLCVLIVCYFQVEWIGIYTTTLLYTSKLFAYCFLGTMVEVSSDRIYGALLSSDWYKLPPKQKHQFLLMVLAAQRPAVLMAGTVPLNLDTFVNVR